MVCSQWCARNDELVLNLDALTYAGNLANLQALEGNELHRFVQGNIGDAALLGQLFAEYKPRAVVHFAAESHVDRSITGPEAFVETNVMGTFRLLEAARAYWTGRDRQAAFRTRSMERWAPMPRRSPRQRLTRRTVRTPRARRPVITWCALTITPTGCRC